MEKRLTIILLCIIQLLSSQNIIETNKKADEIISHLSNGGDVEWAIPISKTEKLPLKWYRRTSSLEKKEGIITFVGYKDNTFIATISILSKKITGSVNWHGKKLNINTKDNGDIIISSIANDELLCGVNDID